eukprot:CAMPEP_0119315458 /NCGR_PEP_ID=MMETSP1333-20130426/35966_1 /TAXON_ID=418940 /ORGANISM="Scyphosphaera apsteinii, Strain RCC1455" /LENGTH=212 /DNA_ID=CAMNT_0007320825 /DNA_START=22 /DNA_END=657 /DNA_ORIENTATION=+
MPTGRRLSGWKPDDVGNLCDENDDDAERTQAANQKREEAERRAHKARSPYRETPGHQRKTAILTDMYSECARHVQLCAENKVNEKNSWSLDLIDHMGGMIAQPTDEGGEQITNFQHASSTLDAGVKIYSFRVDSVYTETYKLAGGLNRTSRKDGEAEEQRNTEIFEPDDENGDPQASVDATQKKKIGRRSSVATTSNIETNLATLNLKKIEL